MCGESCVFIAASTAYPASASCPEPKDKRRLEYRNKPAIRFAHDGLRFIRGMRYF